MPGNLWRSLIMVGLAANRPTTPDVSASDQGCFYYATDTGTLSMYAGAAWSTITQSAETVMTGITASTTQTRAGALQLTGTVNVVTTSANSGDAVGLPVATVGAVIVVKNKGANPIKVFPTSAASGSDDTIDGGTAGTGAATITNAKWAIFYCTAADTWVSNGGAGNAV